MNGGHGMRLGRDLLRILREDRSATIGAVIIVVYCVVAVIGPAVTTVGVAPDPNQAYEGPSAHFPLGSDAFGHSILSELIVGTRPIMEVGVAAAIMTVAVGVIVGLVSGYVSGAADAVIMRVVDVFLTIPGLPLILVIAAVVRTYNPLVLAAILSIQSWAGLARAVRSMALSLRSSDFIEAARGQAVPLRHMVGRQLLPNVGPYVAIHFLLAVTAAIYAEVGLFLLGVAPLSGTNWGIMINTATAQGALYSSDSALALLAPMGAIVILQIGFVLFSRAMDNLFNPRMRVLV
jgi:peptide/nickel transport system permease protein